MWDAVAKGWRWQLPEGPEWGGDPQHSGEGGLAWLLGQAHLTLSRRRKPPTFPACVVLPGTGVLDEQVYLCEMGFHCLKTTLWPCFSFGSFRVWRYQLWISGCFFFLLQTLEFNYSSQGPYLKGSKNVWEMEKKMREGKEKECVCVCVCVHACVCLCEPECGEDRSGLVEGSTYSRGLHPLWSPPQLTLETWAPEKGISFLWEKICKEVQVYLSKPFAFLV